MGIRIACDPSKGRAAKINQPIRAESCADAKLKALLVKHGGEQAVLLPGRVYHKLNPKLEEALLKAKLATKEG